ncbi:hypothetical protein [Paenibacillus segetis]|nr:hypothetical protein [Paenibacillus segetis]
MIFILCCLGSMVACSIGEAKTPEEWFEFTWSGLAGRDALSFQGNASLVRQDKPLMEENISYYGQLKNHHELEMVTILPRLNEVGTWKTAGNKQTNDEIQSKLLWKGGAWTISANQGEVLSKGMTRLNPLDQLETIRKMNKKITTESGAARGTKVLRIELDPSEAKEMIKEKLTAEMQVLRNDYENKIAKMEPELRNKVEPEINNLWTSGNEQLAKILKQTDAKVIYHLTIGRRNGLPQRLTSESELIYLSPAGLQQREVLLTDNRFSSYQ